MSDSSVIDPANFASPSELSERDNDPSVSITQPKKSRGRLDPTSLDAPREAKRSRGAPNGNKNALRHGFYAKNLGMASPDNLDEREMRNLMGEVGMIKDYMFILYNQNIHIRDSAVLAETLRALALAGMALSRLLIVHNQVRLTRSRSSSTLKDLLADMDEATSRAGHISASVNRSLRDDDEL
jgi:hypothetical protein